MEQLLKVVAQRDLVQRSLSHDVFHAGTASQIQFTNGFPIAFSESSNQRFSGIGDSLQYKTHDDLL
ncbi:hypothetical protein D1872_330890 [compost metagenome]